MLWHGIVKMQNPSQYIPAVSKIATNQRDEGETGPTKRKKETKSESKKTVSE